eukprot:767228-Hanusia_phi.AAC.4
MIEQGQKGTYKIVDKNQKRMLKSISRGGFQRIDSLPRFALVCLDAAAAASRSWHVTALKSSWLRYLAESSGSDTLLAHQNEDDSEVGERGAGGIARSRSRRRREKEENGPC